jgi:hypothetical protein
VPAQFAEQLLAHRSVYTRKKFFVARRRGEAIGLAPWIHMAARMHAVDDVFHMRKRKTRRKGTVTGTQVTKLSYMACVIMNDHFNFVSHMDELSQKEVSLWQAFRTDILRQMDNVTVRGGRVELSAVPTFGRPVFAFFVRRARGASEMRCRRLGRYVPPHILFVPIFSKLLSCGL